MPAKLQMELEIMSTNRDVLDPPEIVMVNTHRVSCNGGGGALGHPRVWYEMGDEDFVECKYCDRRFILIGGKLDPSRGTPGNDEFSVSNGLWEAADDGTRSATEGRFGIKFLQHHSSQHPDKLLEYETEQLERHPFSIILDETR